jgi:hypothetical protein
MTAAECPALQAAIEIRHSDVQQVDKVVFAQVELLLFKQTYLRRCSTLWGNSSTTSSFFVLRWLSIFWITNGSSSNSLVVVLSIKCQFLLHIKKKKKITISKPLIYLNIFFGLNYAILVMGKVTQATRYDEHEG